MTAGTRPGLIYTESCRLSPLLLCYCRRRLYFKLNHPTVTVLLSACLLTHYVLCRIIPASRKTWSVVSKQQISRLVVFAFRIHKNTIYPRDLFRNITPPQGWQKERNFVTASDDDYSDIPLFPRVSLYRKRISFTSLIGKECRVRATHLLLQHTFLALVKLW